jgi:hypothetical protein
MPIDRHADEHDCGERKGDHDLAGDGVAVRDHPQEVGEQNEHEEGEDERKKFAAVMPGIGLDHVGDELVAHFGDRLPSAGNKRPLARAEHDQRGDQRHRNRHQQGRVGVGDVDAADVDRDKPLDLELLEGVDIDRQFSSPRRPTGFSNRRWPHLPCGNPLAR